MIPVLRSLSLQDLIQHKILYGRYDARMSIVICRHDAQTHRQCSAREYSASPVLVHHAYPLGVYQLYRIDMMHSCIRNQNGVYKWVTGTAVYSTPTCRSEILVHIDFSCCPRTVRVIELFSAS